MYSNTSSVQTSWDRWILLQAVCPQLSQPRQRSPIYRWNILRQKAMHAHFSTSFPYLLSFLYLFHIFPQTFGLQISQSHRRAADAISHFPRRGSWWQCMCLPWSRRTMRQRAVPGPTGAECCGDHFPSTIPVTFIAAYCSNGCIHYLSIFKRWLCIVWHVKMDSGRTFHDRSKIDTRIRGRNQDRQMLEWRIVLLLLPARFQLSKGVLSSAQETRCVFYHYTISSP